MRPLSTKQSRLHFLGRVSKIRRKQTNTIGKTSGHRRTCHRSRSSRISKRTSQEVALSPRILWHRLSESSVKHKSNYQSHHYNSIDPSRGKMKRAVASESPVSAAPRRRRQSSIMAPTAREVCSCNRTIASCRMAFPGHIQIRSCLVRMLLRISISAPLRRLRCKAWILSRSSGIWNRQRWIRSGFIQWARSAAGWDVRQRCHMQPPQCPMHPSMEAYVAHNAIIRCHTVIWQKKKG